MILGKHAPLRMLLLVVTTGLIALMAAGFSYYTGYRMSAVYTPLADAVMEIKLEATRAHLWFEEILSGDRNEDIDTVWSHLERADWYATAMLEGGENSGSKFIPLDNPSLLRKIEQVRQLLEQFRGLTRQRFAAHRNAGPGTAIDQQYDAAFKRFIQQADEVEAYFHALLKTDLKHFHSIQSGLLTLIFLITLVVGWLFYHFERERNRNLVQLSKANEELNHAVVHRDRADEEAGRIRLFLQNIVNSMPSMMMGTDEQGKITHWNLEAQRVTGIDEQVAKGKPVAEILPMLSTQMEKVRMAVRDRVSQRVPRYVNFHGKEKRYSDVMIYPLTMNGASGAVIRIDDVTDQVRVEEMMVQTEKMVSIGGLAAGMAHEINNPLGGILQGLQNVCRRLSPDLDKNLQVARDCGVDLSSIRNYLEQRQILQFLDGMEDAGKRAANIVANMLQFSRYGNVEKQPCSLNGILDRAIELASIDYDLKKRYDFRHVEVIKEYAADLPPAYCIASEIEQVILNLLRNAAQAMNDQKDAVQPPRIMLRTRREGRNAVIDVEDNGPGMKEEVCSRVMEPFFTTKPVGLGTGLGLSVSYFIIKDGHNGEMTVQSAPGKGSLFTISLPIERSV